MRKIKMSKGRRIYESILDIIGIGLSAIVSFAFFDMGNFVGYIFGTVGLIAIALGLYHLIYDIMGISGRRYE